MRKGEMFFWAGIIVAVPAATYFGLQRWVSPANSPYVSACEGAMRDQLTQPATFESRSSDVEVIKSGMVMTHVRFNASNAFGAVGHYSGLCITNGASTTGTMSIDTGG